VGLAVGVFLIGFLSLRSLSLLWTDQMWFSSVGLGRVFSTLFWLKVGMGLTFGAIFFALMWGNLLLTDRFGARDLSFDVRSFRRFVLVCAKPARRRFHFSCNRISLKPHRSRLSADSRTSCVPTLDGSTR